MTRPCHMHKSRDLEISSWRLLAIYYIYAASAVPSSSRQHTPLCYYAPPHSYTLSLV